MKYMIRLDICTLCTLNCVACPIRKINYGKLKAGYVKFEIFKKFIDENLELIRKIEISSAGEPLLNPDLIKILKYAYENNIVITCRNGTNFNSLDDAKIKALVDYKVEDIVFACDGATQETYQKYRRNGDINKVFDSVRKIQEYKKKINSEYPRLIWQYIIRESTESKEEIELAKKLAKEFNVELKFKLTHEINYTPKNSQELKEITGLKYVTRKEAADNGEYYLTASKCRQLWNSPAINWNGDLLGCCWNWEPFNINVFEVGLAEALKNKEYCKAKMYLSDKIENDKSIPCMNCEFGEIVHNNHLIDDCWIKTHDPHYNKEN